MLYPTIVERSPVPYSGTPKRKATRHPLIRPGTICLWDSRLAVCHPDGALSAGVKETGTAFRTLGWPDAEGADRSFDAVVTGGGLTVNADGSIALPGAPGSSLNVGTPGQINLSGREFLFTLAVQIPTAGYTTANFAPIASLTPSDANAAQLWLDFGVGGLRPRGTFALGGGNSAVGYAADIVPGPVMNLAIRLKPSVRYDFFRDATVVAAVDEPNGVPSVLPSSATAVLKILSGVKASLYGFALHDITTCGAAEASFGEAPLTVTEHLEADRAFGRGVLNGAPSLAFG